MILFQNQTTNDDSAVEEIIDGSYRNAKATGVFDGAIITFQADHRDDDYAPMIEDSVAQTITIPGVLNLQPFKSGMRLKAVLSNAGASTDITLKTL